ncbi:MAG: 50S ribosomal protein L25 [Planctomycetes bacterium]|nr:50S ribosomal protein L25 [Planctomycetota bacterium]
MSDVLHVEVRPERGTRAARKMRAIGRIPAVLYGHGEESISLSIAHEEIESAVRHRSHLVNLEGSVTESALIQSLQWDTFGVEILHVDLYRVRKGETHEATVAVRLRGDAPGAKEGGIVQQVLHEVEIMCPVESIPDLFEVNINEVHIDDEITVSILELPQGASLITPEEEVIVRCVDAAKMAAPVEEEEEAVAGESEPEIIRRKEEEEEGEGEGE